MKLRILPIVCLFAGAACAERSVAPVQPRSSLGSTHVAPGNSLPDTRPPPLAIVPTAARRLAAAVATLEREAPRRGHPDMVRALRALADAALLVSPGQLAERAAIARAADELEAAPARSAMHADHVRAGLDAALRLFASARPWSTAQVVAFGDAVRTLARDVEAVQGDVPLRAERPDAITALASACRTVYVAIGANTAGCARTTISRAP